jgi:hypothetical protein
MRNLQLIRYVLAAGLALLAPTSLVAQQDDTASLNHLSLSARAGFNITGRFKDLGNVTLTSPRVAPDGFHYTNGYVLTDISGNMGGQTWNWGYSNATQISGNTILMSTLEPDVNAESPNGLNSGDISWGWELTYDRELGSSGNWHYGVEGAINYTTVSFNDSSTFSGLVNQVTDAFAFTPGTTPPTAPYQGTFNGPGFLIGSTPSSSTSTVVGNSVITGHRQFDSDIWGVRLGPYVEYSLTDKLDISLSAGLAAGLLVNSASWNETIFISGNQAGTSVGSGDSTGTVWGGYVSANVAWEFTSHWTVEGGVQFQDLGKYQQDVGSRAVELDLSKSLFVKLGVGCRF